ncbi:MAG: membrane dipeptidase, partial [Solobacterium sp.]|nr:membrane dipeptidase [Solobacterium sp.]
MFSDRRRTARCRCLADALKAEGFTEDEIEKIYYRNVLRVMKDAVK